MSCLYWRRSVNCSFCIGDKSQWLWKLFSLERFFLYSFSLVSGALQKQESLIIYRLFHRAYCIWIQRSTPRYDGNRGGLRGRTLEHWPLSPRARAWQWPNANINSRTGDGTVQLEIFWEEKIYSEKLSTVVSILRINLFFICFAFKNFVNYEDENDVISDFLCLIDTSSNKQEFLNSNTIDIALK